MPMTPRQHVKEAERLLEEGDAIMDADHGMYARMDSGERVRRRTGAYLGALAHLMFVAAAEE